MLSARRSRGSLEREVLAVLEAAAEGGLTPAQVRDRLDTGRAYTTVMTVLVRLSEKGLVTREPAGRGYAYAAVRDRAALTAQRMQHLLGTGTDRAGVLARFVDTLSPEDERLLRDLLRDEGHAP